VSGEPRPIRWSWASRDSDIRTGYLAVDGRITIKELLTLMDELAPGVEIADIAVNWATVVWSRPATDEELAERARHDARAAARHAAWEREALARLYARYGPPDPSWLPDSETTPESAIESGGGE
jgi:hypothetical protein